jgi:hypothetical protein
MSSSGAGRYWPGITRDSWEREAGGRKRGKSPASPRPLSASSNGWYKVTEDWLADEGVLRSVVLKDGPGG